MKTTPKRRQAIQDRIAAATEGPWTLGDSKYVIRGPKDPGQSWGGNKPIITRVRANQEYRPGNYDEANADLMAHAREDLPDLLEDLQRLGMLLLECLETYETQQDVFRDSPVVLGSIKGSWHMTPVRVREAIAALGIPCNQGV